MRPITPTILLDSICWSISEPTSTASIYTDSFSSEDASECHTPQFFDTKGGAKDSEASFAHLTRSLTERYLPFFLHFLQYIINFSCFLFHIIRSALSHNIHLYVPVCSEKSEVIFKNNFLTMLFPSDRFSDMGPSSRTFFSDDGFTCLQVLDHIYAFYQVQF